MADGRREVARLGAAGRGNTEAGAADLAVLLADQKTAGDLPYRIASHLWGPSLVNIVNNRLAKAESLQAVAGAVILASTVPTDVARAMLWKAIGDHSGEGPDELLSAGLTTRVFNDPAFLLVLKSQKRADPKPESAAKRLKEIREGGRGPGGGPGGGSKPSGGGPPGGPSGYGGNSAPSQERSPEQRWMLACETMARALCAHFAAAGKVGGGSKEAAESRPFELPPRVETIAEYDFTWPESVSGKAKLSGVPLDPMAIHYVRMERETTPGRALSFFRRLPRARSIPLTTATGWKAMPGTLRQAGDCRSTC